MAAARSRIAVVLAALGVFVAACLVGDHGAARAAVGQSTGPLIGSDRPDVALLVARGMKPGESRAGEVTITNVGDAAGAFVLGATGLADTGARLSDVLDLDVADITPGRAPTDVYAGPPSGLGRVALGTLQQNESRRYRFTVTVPVSAGNAYQASSTTVSFAWTTAAVAGAPTPAPTPAPPPATAAAGPGVAPTATLTASAHQSGAKGSVAVSVACNVRCAAVVSGSALDGTTKIPLRAVRRAVLGRARLRIALPARAREALSQHRTLAVRLRLKATMGTTVVVARRTISVGSTRG